MARGPPRPNAIAPEPAAATTTTTTTTTTSRVAAEADDQEQPEPAAAVLTVWRKSLLLSCSGFTVFDSSSGALAFRVDTYDSASSSSRSRHGLPRFLRRAADVVLMDVSGAPLLTVRRRRSTLARLGLAAPDCCLIFAGESKSKAAKPLLSVRRARHGLLGGSSGKAPLAYVTPLPQSSSVTGGDGGGGGGEGYVVEGSYGARACAVREARGEGRGVVVAEVRRKERVGDDVFRLVAGPRIGAPLAVAVVIALDEMFAAVDDDGNGGGAGLRKGKGAASWPSVLRRTWSA